MTASRISPLLAPLFDPVRDGKRCADGTDDGSYGSDEVSPTSGSAILPPADL